MKHLKCCTASRDHGPTINMAVAVGDPQMVQKSDWLFTWHGVRSLLQESGLSASILGPTSRRLLTRKDNIILSVTWRHRSRAARVFRKQKPQQSIHFLINTAGFISKLIVSDYTSGLALSHALSEALHIKAHKNMQVANSSHVRTTTRSIYNINSVII